jgi:hypothetical protein
MANKYIYSFHEERDALDVITNGFSDGFATGREGSLVAKYYKKEFGYGEVRLERAVIDFCKKHDPSFNAIVQADSIEKWVRDAMNFDFRKVTNVRITHAEMREIKKIKDLRSRKILFMILVLSKSTPEEREKYYFRDEFLPLLRDALDFKSTELTLAGEFKPFIDAGLIVRYSPESKSCFIKFASNDGSVAMRIPDPSQALERYRSFFGGDIFYCANGCGTEIVKTGNKTKYCPECAKTKEKIRKAEFKRRQKGAK